MKKGTPRVALWRPFGPPRAPKGPPEHQGPFRTLLGPMWDPFGTHLGPIWDHFGPIQTHLGLNLDPFRTHFEYDRAINRSNIPQRP